MGRPLLRRLRLGLLAPLLMVVGTVGEAQAQELGTECDLVGFGTWNGTDFGGTYLHFISRPVLVCPDGTQIRADSAVVYDVTARSELIGNVNIVHPERRLRAAYADYYEREGRLFARGAVEFEDLLRGSELRGDTLTLLEAGDLRVEQEVNVSGRPAFAIMVPSEAPPEADAPVELEAPAPYEVTAARIRFQGERFFWASGDATVVRDSLTARADSLAFDQEAGSLFLTGNAEVQRDVMELEGDRITLVLPDDVLRSVELIGQGRIRTEEMEAVGDEVRLLIDDEKVQRLLAVRRADPSADPDRPRPQLIAEGIFVESDSIDVVSPGEVLQSLTAVGRARVERRLGPGEGDEIVEVAVPPSQDDAPADEDFDQESEELLDSLPVHDWLEGDVVVATFLPPLEVVSPEPDSIGAVDADPTIEVDPTSISDPEPGPRLERMTATGNAKSWYRAPPDDATATDRRRWAISYLLADEIAVYLTEGAVDWIEAIGSVRGWQSEPEELEGAALAPVTVEDRQ